MLDGEPITGGQEFRKILVPHAEFLHPRRGNLPEKIPLGGQGIRDIVDAPRVDQLQQFPSLSQRSVEPRSLEEVAFTVRLRYQETAEQIDRQYYSAMLTYAHSPQDVHALEEARKAIALAGTFNRVRGIQILRKIDPDGDVPHDSNGIPTANVQRDTEIAPNMTLSPSALYQLQKVANISSKDNVLYLFSGTGGGVFFASATNPRSIDAVDLYTPRLYDLQGTFNLAKQEIFSDVPEKLLPHLTEPNFIQADAARLPDFNSETAREAGFKSNKYNKILCHPPYGRESMLAENLSEVSEGDSFMTWVTSILSANRANHEAAQVFSIIPPQWGETLDGLRKGRPVGEVLESMYGKLRDLDYYKSDENQMKLEKPLNPDLIKTLDEPQAKQEIARVFGSQENTRISLKEMGMFPLQINVINIPGS